MLLQERKRPRVREVRCGLVVMIALEAREGVVHVRVAVDLDVRHPLERCFHLRLSLGRDELVLLGAMKQERFLDVRPLLEHAIEAHAVIADRRVAVGACGGQVRELAAKAVADAADLAVHLGPRAQHLDRRGDVLHAGVDVELLEAFERALPARFGVVEIDAGLHAPEEIGCKRDKTLPSVVLADEAHVLVDAEDLLLDHEPGAFPRRREAEVTAELAAVGGRNVDEGAWHGGSSRGKNDGKLRSLRGRRALSSAAVHRVPPRNGTRFARRKGLCGSGCSNRHTASTRSRVPSSPATASRAAAMTAATSCGGTCSRLPVSVRWNRNSVRTYGSPHCAR